MDPVYANQYLECEYLCSVTDFLWQHALITGFTVLFVLNCIVYLYQRCRYGCKGQEEEECCPCKRFEMEGKMPKDEFEVPEEVEVPTEEERFKRYRQRIDMALKDHGTPGNVRKPTLPGEDRTTGPKERKLKAKRDGAQQRPLLPGESRKRTSVRRVSARGRKSSSAASTERRRVQLVQSNELGEAYGRPSV